MIELCDSGYHNTKLDCDLCVVGSGAAGITIARDLIGSRLNVVVLAGGDFKESAAARDLHVGVANPEAHHEPLEENRRRQVGGATTAWGGRCIPFDQQDFEKRPWIPDSGWPFKREHLRQNLVTAAKTCDIGNSDFDARSSLAGPSEIIAGLDNEQLISWALERWSPPVNFARRFAPELRAAPNVRLLLQANAMHLQLHKDRNRVVEIKAGTLAGVRFTVRPRHVILAAGGLENARLLLASRDVASNGIGNDLDLVGRFYMSHVFGTHCVVRLREPEKMIYGFERDQAGVYVRRRWQLTAEAQEKARVGNGAAFFFRPALGVALHRDPLFSAAFIAKYAKRLIHQRNFSRIRESLANDREVLLEHAGIVARGGVSLAPAVVRVLYGRFVQTRRLPFVLPPQSCNAFHLFYQTEHMPNRDSRVVLDQTTDALEMPRLKPCIRFCDLDVETAVALNRVFAERVGSTGVGSIDFHEDQLRERITEGLRHFNSNAHHIGTTRMSNNPANGVVNPDCQVHGVHNLSIAGSSVFPTSGHANPTFLLVALAHRLAAKLRQDL